MAVDARLGQQAVRLPLKGVAPALQGLAGLVVGEQHLHDPPLSRLRVHGDLGVREIQGGGRIGQVGLPHQLPDVLAVLLKVADAQHHLAGELREGLAELAADGGGAGGVHNGGHLLPGAAVGDLYIRLIAAHDGGDAVLDVLHRIGPQGVLLDHLQAGLVQHLLDRRLVAVPAVKADGSPLGSPADEVDQGVHQLLVAPHPDGVALPVGLRRGAVGRHAGVVPIQDGGAPGGQRHQGGQRAAEPSFHPRVLLPPSGSVPALLSGRGSDVVLLIGLEAVARHLVGVAQIGRASCRERV